MIRNLDLHRFIPELKISKKWDIIENYFNHGNGIALILVLQLPMWMHII